MPTPRKKRRRPPKRMGIFNNGNMREGGKFTLRLVVYLITGLITIWAFGKGCAEEFIQTTVRPMIDAQTKAIEDVGDNAEVNSQAILNLNETLNLQIDWIKADLQNAKEARKEIKEQIDNLKEK